MDRAERLYAEVINHPESTLVDHEGPPAWIAVTGLFSLRRKQLVRGIRQLTGWSADDVAKILQDLGLDPTARPETVAPPGFVALTRALVDLGWRPD